MTAEEFIQSNVINDNGYEQHSCEMVAKRHALTAIGMARNETINSVWHDNNVMPKCNEDCLIIDEQGNIDYGYLVYDDFNQEYTFSTDSWYYTMGNIKKWAYAKELLPSNDRKNEEKLCVYPIENTIPTNHQRL